MKFSENRFSKNLSIHLSNNETLLLEKIVGALHPAPAFLNIAHQLKLLLTSLSSLNNLNLPVALQSNNSELICVLKKVTATEIFDEKIFIESTSHTSANPMFGYMDKHPIATLFSTSFHRSTNENIKKLIHCILAITFWSSFNGLSKEIIDYQSEHIRKFIEKKVISNNEINIAGVELSRIFKEWKRLLLENDYLFGQVSDFSRLTLQLTKAPPLTMAIAANPETSQKQRISNLTTPKKISSDTKATIQTRRYVPLLATKEEVAEDNSIEFTNLSVETGHYIDEEALDQSYLYGSRLTLQELMQLSLRPVSLLDYEILVITNHIKQVICADNIDKLKDAILTLILLCTSKGYEYIEALPIHRYENKEKYQVKQHDCICLETGTWNRLDVRMPDAFTATDEQKVHLEKVDHLVRLPLPTILITALKKSLNKGNIDSITTKALCNIDHETLPITTRITNLFNNGIHQGRNITPASIRNLLFEIISKKETPAIASLLLANTEYGSNTSLYYLFQSHQKIRLIYQNSLSGLGFSSTDINIEDHLFCGSELAIKQWHSRLIISDKYSEITTQYKNIDDRSPLSTLINIHNQITLYATLVLLITTGHRTRIEYSFSDFSIDEKKELICIADKQNFCDSALRILPLADVTLENLKAYRIHCDRLSRLIVKHDPILSQQLLKTSQNLTDAGQPLLYLINQDLTISPVGYEGIERYLSDWNLPTNAFRHYFFSFLQSTAAKSVSGNFMGHIRSGEHIYANDSLFCNNDMMQKKNAINMLAESLNCQPLIFPIKTGRRVPLVPYDKETLYTPHYLLNNSTFNKNKLRRSVRKLLSEAYKDKPLFFKDIQATKEKLLAKIFEEKNLTSRELNYKLKILDKFITKIVGIKKLPSISKTYADKEVTRLKLKKDSLFKAKEADLLKETLQTWVLATTQNEPISKNAANREFIKIIISLIVHSSFSFPIDTAFIHALKTPLFKDGNVLWLTWIDNNKNKQRVFIDSITAQLIINNPIYLKTKLKHPSEIGKTLFQYLSVKIKKLPLQQKILGNKKIDINKLIQFLNNRFFFTHTGLSQSYLNQKRKTTHLPDEVLTRWLRNSPCYNPVEESTEEDVFIPQSLHPPSSVKSDDKSIILGTDILSNIRKQLNQILKKSGHASSKMLIGAVTNSWGKAINRTFDGNLQEMINQSLSLTQTTIASLCWLYYTAGKPGKGRTTIAIKTLFNYISKVAKPLIITADTQPFFTLSQSELQSLYIKAIESRKVKHKNEAAKVLRVFGNYIYDSFKIPKVSWLEIEPSIYGETNDVRSNIISQREYEEIRLYLKNNGTATHDDRLINQTIFTLCYRLGLRKSEAENLMVEEVDFENSVIHINTNRYDRIKSDNGNRRLPMDLFLSSDEIDDLKQLVKRTLQFNNQKRNVGIFSRPLSHTELIDFAPHTKAISHAMKTITHDPSISLHICRHSFANYLYLLVCRGALPPSIRDELKAWSRSQEDHQLFTKKLIGRLLGEYSSPHKILHAISLLFGHEEIATTIKHYIHVLDIISAAENENLLNQHLPIKQVKWVNKLPISNASKIVSRFDKQQRQHIAISYHQLKKFNHFKEVDVIRIDSKAVLKTEEKCVKGKNSLLYDITMTEIVLRAVEDKLSTKGIAQKVTFSELEIEKIIQISEHLKSEIAYDGVIIHSSNPNIEFYNNSAKANKTKAYVNVQSYKKILEKLNQLSEKNRNYLLKIWRENYNRRITGYMIMKNIDNENFYTIINALGYQVNVKNDYFTVKDRAKSSSFPLIEVIDPTIGEGKNSINLKLDHALFLLTINSEFTNLSLY